MADCTEEQLEFMRAAFAEARRALNEWEVPVGCVFVRDGEIVAAGSNKPNATRNGTRHAELEAIDALIARCGSVEEAHFDRCDVYVTCEPCIMCAAALSVIGVRHVYFGCRNDKFGGCGTVLSVEQTACSPCGGENLAGLPAGGRPLQYTAGIMEEQAVELFRAFYVRGNPKAPRPHRPLQGTPPPVGGTGDAQLREGAEGAGAARAAGSGGSGGAS